MVTGAGKGPMPGQEEPHGPAQGQEWAAGGRGGGAVAEGRQVPAGPEGEARPFRRTPPPPPPKGQGRGFRGTHYPKHEPTALKGSYVID